MEKFYGDDFTMKIISGSLPPGLQLTSVSPAAGILSVPDGITVTDNLGGTATIPVTVNSRYS